MEGLVDTFSNRLKTAMRIRDIKATELSVKTGIAKSSLSEYINGKYEAKQDGVYLLAKALNINEAWLMGLDVPMERDIPNKEIQELKGSISLKELFKDKVPLLGTVKAGYNYLANENIIDYIAINFKKENDYEYFALKIVGDSMETIMSEGDFVIIQKQNEFNSGDFCVVLINGEEATVKRVFKLDTGIKLVALNPLYKDTDYTFDDMKKVPIEIIGIVKQLIKNLN